MTTIPFSTEPRPSTGMTNARLGIWLFLASEAMFFASLFSGYVLLRTGAASWPEAGAFLDPRRAYAMTPILIAATFALRASATPGKKTGLLASSFVAAAFVLLKLLDYGEKIAAGLTPSTNLLLACWFTLTAAHALHVVAGIAANLWAAAGFGVVPARDRERLGALRLYWYFVDIVWFVILVSFYLI